MDGRYRVPDDVAVATGRSGTLCSLSGDTEGAVRRFGQALEAFVRLDLRYEAARTHLLSARALGEHDQPTPSPRHGRPLAMFDNLNAAADVDEAAAYLRTLGVRAARTGPRGTPELTRREQQVLSLLEEGLTNQQIATRLFLTRKTVEHHVRSLLAKLNVSSRTEAVARVMRDRHRSAPD